MKSYEIQRELHNSMLVFEIMGLQYFSLKSVGRQMQNNPQTWRVVQMLATLIVLTTLTIVYVMLDEKVEDTKVNAKNILMFTISRSTSFGLIFVVIISVLQSFFSTQKCKQFFLNTKQIVQILQQNFKVDDNFWNLRKFAWIRCLVLFGFMIVLQVLITLHNIQSNAPLWAIAVSFPAVFCFLVIVYKFVFYVVIVNAQLSSLNLIIRQMIEFDANVRLNIKSYFVDVKPSMYLNEYSVKLRALRKIYNLIFKNANLINRGFGLTVLIIVIDSVVICTAMGYEVFVHVMGGLPLERAPGLRFTVQNLNTFSFNFFLI